ncbi:MAG TPA: hypothetical protein DHM90_15015 [Clostridiaceae bacterium]|nr:hypothetical protein [Clostridiaceae bacterium]
MLEVLLQLVILGIFFVIGIAGIYLLFSMMKSSTPFQKLNRFTLLAVLATFFGLLTLRYSLFNSLLGSTLVLFLIRISYVIYIDAE